MIGSKAYKYAKFGFSFLLVVGQIGNQEKNFFECLQLLIKEKFYNLNRNKCKKLQNFFFKKIEVDKKCKNGS